jgi:hypothetical protein
MGSDNFDIIANGLLIREFIQINARWELFGNLIEFALKPKKCLNSIHFVWILSKLFLPWIKFGQEAKTCGFAVHFYYLTLFLLIHSNQVYYILIFRLKNALFVKF